MADLLNNGVAFNKRNFDGEAPEHRNSGVDYLFNNLSNNNIGENYITAVWPSDARHGIHKDLFIQNWWDVDKQANNINILLNLDKKKQEILDKYNIEKSYFDNTISLHIRCGDTKASRVEPFDRYAEAILYINKITNADKVICFYEDDDFSTKTATEIIDKLRKIYPGITFEKCIHVDNDAEELLMMSMCKHNIQSLSFFVKWATNFNTNPNKVIFPMGHTVDFNPIGGNYDGT